MMHVLLYFSYYYINTLISVVYKKANEGQMSMLLGKNLFKVCSKDHITMLKTLSLASKLQTLNKSSPIGNANVVRFKDHTISGGGKDITNFHLFKLECEEGKIFIKYLITRN